MQRQTGQPGFSSASSSAKYVKDFSGADSCDIVKPQQKTPIRG
jgi:hypothetical protein